MTYEYFKSSLAEKRKSKHIESGNLMQSNGKWQWVDNLAAAAIAKLIAAGISYPHEVCFIRFENQRNIQFT